MSEEAVVVVESKATPEVQAKAEKLGWIPPVRFKGDMEHFIDADAYIERGEIVLPIIKEHNRRLEKEVSDLREENTKTAAALKAAQDAIEQIEERHSVETQKAVENARKQLKAQLAQASEAGDHEAVAELTDQMVQLNKADDEAKPAEKKPDAPAFKPTPDLQAWNAENPWFGSNKRRTALALGIAQELRDAGESSTGRAFFDKVAAEVEKELGGKAAEPRGDKVEGARGGTDGETRGRKGFTSLPSDAKAACDADYRDRIKQKYKTIGDWRSRYAELYYAQES